MKKKTFFDLPENLQVAYDCLSQDGKIPEEEELLLGGLQLLNLTVFNKRKIPRINKYKRKKYRTLTMKSIETATETEMEMEMVTPTAMQTATVMETLTATAMGTVMGTRVEMGIQTRITTTKTETE